jgi:hypothetical protein
LSLQSDAGHDLFLDVLTTAIFTRLNLKGHRVKKKTLYGPGGTHSSAAVAWFAAYHPLTPTTDIEGHWGADGKLYLLDFSRLYPPESIQQTQDLFPANPMANRALFYKMLRPGASLLPAKAIICDHPTHPPPHSRMALARSFQSWYHPTRSRSAAMRFPFGSRATLWFVQSAPCAIHQARFHLTTRMHPCLFSGMCEQAKEHNDEVRAATTRLIQGIIPDLALEIVFRCLKLKDDPLNDRGETVQTLHTHLQHILHRMHTCGVNMRFLGTLRSRFLLTAKQYDLHVLGHIDTVYASLMFTEVSTLTPIPPSPFWLSRFYHSPLTPHTLDHHAPAIAGRWLLVWPRT